MESKLPGGTSVGAPSPHATWHGCVLGRPRRPFHRGGSGEGALPATAPPPADTAGDPAAGFKAAGFGTTGTATGAMGTPAAPADTAATEVAE